MKISARYVKLLMFVSVLTLIPAKSYASVKPQKKILQIKSLKSVLTRTHDGAIYFNEKAVLTSRPTGQVPVQLLRASNEGFIDDVWIKDPTTWRCLPSCIETNDEGTVSIATGETVDGTFPVLWAVTTFIDTSLTPPRRALLITKSINGGETWSWFAVIYSTGGYDYFRPDIAVDVGADPDRLYIAYEWVQSSTNTNVCIVHLNSDGTDFGGGCTTDLRPEYAPRVAVERNQNPNVVAFVYNIQLNASTSYIVLQRSIDQGNTWNGSLLDVVAGPSPYPDITFGVDSTGTSQCHLTYIDMYTNSEDRLYYVKGPSCVPGDLTASFFSFSNSTLTNSQPAIAATFGGGRVAIAVDYINNSDWDIFTAISEDNGQTFLTQTLNLNGTQKYPALASENYGRTNSNNNRSLFWLTFWDGTSSPGHVRVVQTQTPYSAWETVTATPYVDDDQLVPMLPFAQAVSDIMNLLPAITFMRSGTTIDQYYGTYGDIYSFDARHVQTNIHLDIPLTIDGTSYSTPVSGFNWVAYGTHTISAPPEYDIGGTHYTFESWSDGGASTHTITASFATNTTPNTSDYFAYYSSCSITIPEVPFIWCTKSAPQTIRCEWDSTFLFITPDFAIWRSTAVTPWSSWAEFQIVSNQNWFTDATVAGPLQTYLVQGVCGAGGHDHRGPTGYNGP